MNQFILIRKMWVLEQLRWNKGMRGKSNGVQEMKTRLELVGQCVGK